MNLLKWLLFERICIMIWYQCGCNLKHFVYFSHPSLSLSNLLSV